MNSESSDKYTVFWDLVGPRTQSVSQISCFHLSYICRVSIRPSPPPFSL